jgi:hypothetical protein
VLWHRILRVQCCCHQCLGLHCQKLPFCYLPHCGGVRVTMDEKALTMRYRESGRPQSSAGTSIQSTGLRVSTRHMAKKRMQCEHPRPGESRPPMVAARMPTKNGCGPTAVKGCCIALHCINLTGRHVLAIMQADLCCANPPYPYISVKALRCRA